MSIPALPIISIFFDLSKNNTLSFETDLFNKTLDTVISLATIQASNTTITVGDTVATSTANTDGVTSTTTTTVTADDDTDADSTDSSSSG